MDQPQTALETALQIELYEKYRVLVVMEGDEGFQQVLLNIEQFQKILKAIMLSQEENPEGVRLGDVYIEPDIFEGMTDYEERS